MELIPDTLLDRSQGIVIELNVCWTRRCRIFGTWIDRIVKTYDYINRVVLTLPLTVYKGTWTTLSPLVAMPSPWSCVYVGFFFWNYYVSQQWWDHLSEEVGVHAKKCHVGEIIAYYRKDHCLSCKFILLGTYLLARHVEFSCPCGGTPCLLILYVRNSMYNNIKLHIPIIYILLTFYVFTSNFILWCM